MYYIYYGTATERFSDHYTGSTIKHLTATAISKVRFPIPPFNEQRRIVAKIEELFSDLDAGVAALERIKVKLKRYRAAVLKAAVEGRLTTEWRAKNPPKETGPQLLERILRERRCNWEADQLAAFEKAGKKPPAGWKDKYKEPAGPDETNLPELPEALVLGERASGRQGTAWRHSGHRSIILVQTCDATCESQMCLKIGSTFRT